MKDTPLSKIHAHLVVVLSTGVLMWAYAITAYLYIDNPLPGQIGFVCSLIHVSSLFLWIFSKNQYAPMFFTLVPGLIHQTAFAYFSGGYYSEVVIWFGIHPLLAGVVNGKKGLIFYGALSFLVSISFLGLELSGHDFPNEISTFGMILSQTFILFGYFLIGVSCVWVYLQIREKNEYHLQDKNAKIQTLLKVLIHDITNPLSVVEYQVETSLKKEEMNDEVASRLRKAKKAVNVATDISKKIRQFHADGENIDRLESCDLDECFDYVNFIFEKQFLEKRIRFRKGYERSFEFKTAPEVFKNQVLLNLVSNAIKFTPAGGTITLEARRIPGEVHVGVRDNGVGMSEDKVVELREKGKTHSTIGLGGEKGSGFGLMIMHTFVSELGGKVEIFSREKFPGKDDHGSLFRVKIPS